MTATDVPDAPMRVRLTTDYQRQAAAWSLFQSRCWRAGSTGRVVGPTTGRTVTVLFDTGVECGGPCPARYLVIDQHDFVLCFERCD